MIDVLRVARVFGAGTGLVVLAACGGSSTSESGGVNGANYQQLVDRYDALAEEVEFLDDTPVEDMPVSGTASYAGVAQITSESDVEALVADVAGEVEVEADFAAGTLDGRMFGFLGQDDQVVSGELDITFGQITGNSVDFDVSGTLAAEGIAADFDLTGTGAFGGADAGYMAGVFGGDVASDAGTGSALGVFIARRAPGVN